MNSPYRSLISTSLMALAAVTLSACSQPEPPTTTAANAAAASELAALKATEAQEQKNLATFDDLDFNVYSNQKWEDLGKSHAPASWCTGRTAAPPLGSSHTLPT